MNEETLKEWCKNNNQLFLLDEWDYKNNPFSPDEIKPKSGKEIWWICKNNHSYHSKLYTRTSQNCGCPYCSGQKILKGYNDLATKHPEVLKLWDYERNNKKPDEFTCTTKQRINLICDKKHRYGGMVGDLVRRNFNCPYCSNRKVLLGFFR